MNKEQITTKTEAAIRQQLYQRGYATCIDTMVSIGWLKPKDVIRWHKGEIPYLERVCCTNLGHLNTFLKAYQQYAKKNGYKENWTCYRHKKTKKMLRFSKSGNEVVEKRYATHIVCMECKKKEKTKEASDEQKSAK